MLTSSRERDEKKISMDNDEEESEEDAGGWCGEIAGEESENIKEGRLQ